MRFFSLGLCIALAAAACSSSSDSTNDAGQGNPDAGAGDGASGDALAEAAPDAGSDAMEIPDAPPASSKLIILHTNDLHSHLTGHAPEADYSPLTVGDDQTVGGLARIAARIKAERAAAGDTPLLLLDSGDFLMGTPFELLAPSASSELTLMNDLGYDATTLGNHEFDWGPAGLTLILTAAAAQGVKVPILATNTQFDDTSPDDDGLAALMTSGVLQKKLVKTLPNGLRVGFFGLLGKDAATVAPLAAPVTFRAIADAATDAVKDLRENDHVNMVIALSHSGSTEAGTGEDVDLAKAVSGIDVIISGHTHSVLPMPIQTGKTLIVQTGAYGEHLGKLVLNVTYDGTNTTVDQDSYTLSSVDDSVAGDPAVDTKVNGYIAALDATLAPSGLAYEKVLAKTSVDLRRGAAAEAPVGNFVTDAYRTITAALQPSDPPVLAVEANGDLRADLVKGKTGALWFADFFRVQPLGIGPDRQPGTPLVTFYVTGPEIKAGFEVGPAAVTLLSTDDYFLQQSGAVVEEDSTAGLLNRVKRISIGGTDISLTDTTACYKVVTNLAVGVLLGRVKDLSSGLLSVTPKEKDCTTPVADLTKNIVDSNPMTADRVEELKAWQALVAYTKSLPDSDGDGVPDMPAAYGAPQGRIVISP